MDISRLWTRFKVFVPLSRASALSSVQPQERFHAIIRCERARADRNEGQFSVVLFNVGDPDANSTRVQYLAHVLANRIRSTDEAGWFDAHRIGVLLPETFAVGAWRLADDICQAIAAKATAPECTVYTYPPEWLSNGKGHSTQLHFADLSPEWKTTSLRGFSSSTRHANEGKIDFHAQQPLANATPNCLPVAEMLESFFVCPLPVWKRSMDVVGAIVGLILFSPIMLAAVVAIKLSSPGRIIFRQRRAGGDAKPFTLYKFRTMVNNAQAIKKTLTHLNEQTGPVFKVKRDPRITPVGRLLRKTSIDELPQLWNVLKGDMSLVGPRPPTLDEVSHYEIWQYGRLAIIPGITCTWQVSGRSKISFEDWVRMDVHYAKTYSLMLDLKILLRTPLAVLSQEGAW